MTGASVVAAEVGATMMEVLIGDAVITGDVVGVELN